VRLYPLLLVGIYAFLLALNAFGTVLVAQSPLPQPFWLWALSGVVMAGEVAAMVWCYRRAKLPAS
jgi:hypothetical protein